MRTALALALLMFFGAQAHAQTSDDERARTHFEAGRSYYEQARYDDASREFKNAFDLSGRSALLLNLSQAHERSLHFDEAIADIQKYLQLVPDSPDRKTLEERMQRLRELSAKVAAQPTAAPAAQQPAPAPEPAAPAPAAAVAGAAPEQERSHPLLVPGWVLVGSGGAVLAGSLITGLLADSKHSALADQCVNGSCPPSAQSKIDSGKSLALVSTVLLFVGVVAGGIGATLLIVDAGGDSNETASARAGQVRLASGPTPIGAGAEILF